MAMICGMAAGPVGAQVNDLVLAAGRGDVAAVNALLQAGVNPNTPSSGRTAIVAASMNGHLDVVKALLAARADTEAGATTSTGNMSALYWALQNGHAAVGRILVEAGASMVVKSDYGAPLISLAARGSDADSLAIVRALISRNANAQAGLFPAVQTGSVEIVQALLVAGARADSLVPFESYPPVANGIQNLIKSGLINPPQVIPAGGDTLLMLAAFRGRADVMRVLLGAGADANATSPAGGTALMAAVAGLRTEAVQVLLKAGADVNTQRNDGSTALMMAVPQRASAPQKQASSTAIVVMLREAEASAQGIRHEPAAFSRAMPSASLPAASRDIVRLLRDAGADVAVRRNDGRTAAMLAADSGFQELVELLDDRAAASPAAN